MKTTLIPNAVLLLTAFAFTTIQLNAAVVAKGTMVETVKYENTRIPSITLKEVEVSSSPVSTGIFEAVNYNGELIPSIQLSEVSINASGNYNINDIPESMVIKPATKGQRVPVVNYKGEFIPSFQLGEVNIVGDKINNTAVLQTEPAPANTKGIFNVSARQTFDVLINFVVEKGGRIVRHFFPVFDTK